MYFWILSSLFSLISPARLISRHKRAVFQLSRATLPRLRSGDIFVLPMLLNSISPFFSAPLSSVPAGNGREAGEAVFGGDVVVPLRLSENVDRRREQKTAILKRGSSHEILLPLLRSPRTPLFPSPAASSAARPPLITFIVLLVSDTFARKSFPIDNRRLAAAVSQNAHAETTCISLSLSRALLLFLRLHDNGFTAKFHLPTITLIEYVYMCGRVEYRPVVSPQPINSLASLLHFARIVANA